jgi:hypothetical protein
MCTVCGITTSIKQYFLQLVAILWQSDHVKSDNPEDFLLELASFKSPRKGMVIPKPNWRLMVDESTKLKITDLYKKKNDMVEPTCLLIKKLKDKDH